MLWPFTAGNMKKFVNQRSDPSNHPVLFEMPPVRLVVAPPTETLIKSVTTGTATNTM
jgi:hypothetical protein